MTTHPVAFAMSKKQFPRADAGDVVGHEVAFSVEDVRLAVTNCDVSEVVLRLHPDDEGRKQILGPAATALGDEERSSRSQPAT